MRWLAVAGLLASAAPLHAQAYQCRVPDRITAPPAKPDAPAVRVPIAGYTLALTWSPEFCRSRENSAADAIQCGGASGRFGLVLHGLWPEGRGRAPQWCPTPRAVQPPELKRNLCMTPSAGLQAHEWAKHGACMVRTPESYFRVARILWGSLRLPDLDGLSREPHLTVGMLRDKWVWANPGWPRAAVGVRTSPRGWLTEVRLCYDRKFMPAPCNRQRYGPTDATPVKIWRGL